MMIIYFCYQFHQAADKNWDQTGKKQVWRCESNRYDILHVHGWNNVHVHVHAYMYIHVEACTCT